MMVAPTGPMAFPMWPYHRDLLATPVPRYTSYPTAAEFAPISPTRHAQELANTKGDVSLYVHIPFCEQICFYCGCNTGKAGKRQRLESYLAALKGEIETVSAIVSADTTVRRIAFGGGSPNSLTPDEFLHLVDCLVTAFDVERPEFSIELDPRTFSPEWAKAIGRVGISRASLGVQTFAFHCQEAIGRVQTEASIRQSVDLLRGEGVSSLNFDLMYGLPGQSLEDLQDSVMRSLTLGPDRIALFGYAHVPQLIARQRVIDANMLPGPKDRFEMAWRGHQIMTAAGYRPIGFDHFAKPDDPLARATTEDRLSRNFQGFTDDPSKTVIGLGSSAVSSFPKLLTQNEKNNGRYRMLSGSGRLATSAGLARSKDDRMRGDIIQDLLCNRSANLGALLDERLLEDLRPFIDRGLVTLDTPRLSITANGLPYARTVGALLDEYRPRSPRRFSSAV